jgi:GTP-binding protein
VADIPGIIEGAHQGKGLGLQFLRHVERTRLLAFLVPLDAGEPQRVYDQLRQEIRAYSEALFEKPHVVLLSKRDLLPADAELPELEAPGALGVLSFSSISGSGLENLKEYLWKAVAEVRRAASPSRAVDDFAEDEWP